MRIGWDYLSAGEQTYAIAGAIAGLWAYLMLTAMLRHAFGGLAKRGAKAKAKRKKAKAKAVRR